MAERKGFEPSVSYPTQTFQVCTFDHSDTSQHSLSIFPHKQKSVFELLFEDKLVVSTPPQISAAHRKERWAAMFPS